MGKYEENLLRCPVCNSHASTTLFGAIFTRKCYSCKTEIKPSIYGCISYYIYTIFASVPIILFCCVIALYLFNLKIVNSQTFNLFIVSIIWFTASVYFSYQWMKLSKYLAIKSKIKIFIK